MLTVFLMSGLSVMAEDENNGLTPDKLLPQFTNLTPEAASLGRYGAFQVSEYTGTANISVPLYTVESGDISFPISLYYDASGIKVEQDATFVGLGWNLNYGGMISHIVCGNDDFQDESIYRNTYWRNYWDGSASFPNDQPCETYWPVTVNYVAFGNEWGPEDERESWLYGNMSKGYDTPDVFQATFCGHSISFIIDPRAGTGSDGQDSIVVLNDDSRKYRISYSMGMVGSFNYPTSFTITDDKGITYLFNAYCENEGAFLQVDSYYLTKIYGSDGINGRSTVSFEYVQPCYFHYGRYSRPARKSHRSKTQRIYGNNDEIPNTENFPIYFYSFLNGFNSEPEIGCGENGACNKVYPNRIIAALDTIEFERSTREDIVGAMRISGITVKSKIGGVQKTISFAYDYFHEAFPQDSYSGKRLKLTGVTVDAKNYRFEYDSQDLPAFTSYSKDYWGYYNGANPNSNCFIGCSPAYTISNGLVMPENHLDGSNRLASEELCNVGMLRRIIYPTGGYTDYEYEIHRFNDKYYYPDASHSISFPVSTSTINLYGTMTGTSTVTAHENCRLQINGLLYGTSDTLTVTVKNSQGSPLETLQYTGNNTIGETVPLVLTEGESYTIEAKLKGGASTTASCTFSSDINTASPTTYNENGGYSIGGGLRVKTVKNYDSDSTYLNGVEYKYSEGKLLSPTVQLERHFVEFSYKNPAGLGNDDRHPNVSFYYANTEPSYQYICSLGIPGTVGYDTVEKKEIDGSGNVIRKTVLEFYNYGYISDDGNTNNINLRMQNTFYFNSYYNNNPAYAQGHLNGRLKKERVYSGTGSLAYTAEYTYSSVRQGSVLYPKCIPTHFPGFKLAAERYDLAYFRKFIAWSFLTSKSETYYDNSGSISRSDTTTYSYNPSNYQPSVQTVSDGLNSESTRYWYPSDNGNASTGLSHLINKHHLSEVTGIDILRNNVYTTGSRYNYTMSNNLPVVSSCYSILPNSTAVLQMQVTGYDNAGNIREYYRKDGTPVTLIWSYNHQYPIIEVVGKRYSEVLSASSTVSQLQNYSIVSYTTLKSVHNSLQGLSGAHVTAYLYSPWRSVSRIIYPNGHETIYDYDIYGRLKKESDASGILKKYQYNYKNH